MYIVLQTRYSLQIGAGSNVKIARAFDIKETSFYIDIGWKRTDYLTIQVNLDMTGHCMTDFCI